MKVRSGFVSNSSSSSFIVAFPATPNSKLELRDMMFPNNNNDWLDVEEYLEPIKIDDIVNSVFYEIQNQTPNDFENLYRMLYWYSDNEDPDYLDNFVFIDEDGNVLNVTKQYDRDTYNNIHQMLIKHKGGAVYSFIFSDNDGDFWASMEHGNIFRNLDHIVKNDH